MMNPYIQQAQGLDQQGLGPVFQNLAQQQATHNAALAEQNQQVAQAGQQQSGGNEPYGYGCCFKRQTTCRRS